MTYETMFHEPPPPADIDPYVQILGWVLAVQCRNCKRVFWGLGLKKARLRYWMHVVRQVRESMGEV